MTESKYVVKKSIELLNNKTPLSLVEFSHASLKHTTRNKIKFDIFKGGVSYEKRKRILVASTGHLLYSGSNFERETFQITSSVLKVAILNKSTNRMKLYDVDYFVLKPILKCNLKVDSTEKNKVEQNQDLALEFGSKNKKNSVHSKLRFQSAGNDSIDLSILNKIPESIPSIPAAPDPSSNEIIPPQNKNATNVAEIYNIFDIISKEEYCALDSETDCFKGSSFETLQSWKKEAKYCDLIIGYLEINLQCLSHENAKLLCYLQYMMCFLKAGYKDWRKKDPIPDVPEPFKKKMMSRYVVEKSMPQRMKDKLLADAMVLSLTLNHFYIDGKLLASSSKISFKRIISIAYALGCHVHSSKKDDSKTIELKLPLYKYERFGRNKRN